MIKIKRKAIPIIGQVDENHRLTALVPPEVNPGPVEFSLMMPALTPAPENKTAAENAWAAGVALEWADDLGDERQDIYSLTDGEPLDEIR